jgi:hypothetical protein
LGLVLLIVLFALAVRLAVNRLERWCFESEKW